MNHQEKNICRFFNALLLLSCLVSCKHVPYGNNRKAGRYYNIRGFKMYCETYGSGEPLLMIHGNNGSISTFGGLIPHFAENYKVIVADSRSQGKSYDKKDSLSFEMMADDYASLLDAMHIDSAYVIGWSDGGVNALLLAMRHPAKVKKIASSGANLWPDSTAIDSKEWIAEKRQSNQLKNKMMRTDKERNDRKLLLLDWQQPHIPIKSLQNVKCPTLIISGDHDLIKKQHSQLIHLNIPRSNLWIVPNSGHGTLFEHRRKFISNVEDFFSSPFQSDHSY